MVSQNVMHFLVSIVKSVHWWVGRRVKKHLKSKLFIVFVSLKVKRFFGFYRKSNAFYNFLCRNSIVFVSQNVMHFFVSIVKSVSWWVGEIDDQKLEIFIICIRITKSNVFFWVFINLMRSIISFRDTL